MSEEPKAKVSKSSLQANEVLKTQIEASIGVARSLVHSWLPPPKSGEKLDDDDSDIETMNRYSTGRPDRLGLGAKHLSHNEAMRHQTQALSKQEMQLRNKIVNQNQQAASGSTGKRSRNQDNEDEDEDEDDEDDEDSRTKVVASRHGQSTVRPNGPKSKGVGCQGDFLSMYLTEKGPKKKKKRKNKSKQAKQGDEKET